MGKRSIDDLTEAERVYVDAVAKVNGEAWAADHVDLILNQARDMGMLPDEGADGGEDRD